MTKRTPPFACLVLALVACSPRPPAPVAAPECGVPEPAEMDASTLLLERSAYGMTVRRHVFVLRDARALVRISRAPIDGGLVCRSLELAPAERDALVALADGLCEWPAGKDQDVMDQGRLEFRVRRGAGLCKRNEATTSILPSWDTTDDWGKPEPPPLPRWGPLMKALDDLESRAAPGS